MNTESITPISELAAAPTLQPLDFSPENSQPKRLHHKLAKLPKNLRNPEPT